MRLMSVAMAIALGALSAPAGAGPTQPLVSDLATFSQIFADRAEIEFSQPIPLIPIHALEDLQPGAEAWAFVPPNESDAAAYRPLAEEAETRPPGLNENPMAPLPPAILVGPLGMALAGWAAYRVKRRGGQV